MRLHPDAPEPYTLFDGLLSKPRLDHAECVVVAPDGALWCGGEGGQIYRIDGDRIEEVASTGGFLLGLALGPDALYACDLALPGLWRLDLATGTLARFGADIPGHPLVNPNYPVLMPDGGLLVSDSGRAGEPRVGLLRYDPDGRGEVWLDEPLNFANGLAWSPDHRTLYVAESWGYRVAAIDVGADGRPAGPARTYAETPGFIVDGLAVDADGVLYVGAYEPSAVLRIPAPGQVEVFAHDETAHLLCHPTNLAFRGQELVVANLGRWHLTGFELG